jgi:hypothetical protein
MITINEKHPNVIAHRAGLKDLNHVAAILAKKKEAQNNATQRYMAQKSTPRSKHDLEVDQVLSGMGHSVDWISAEKLEELSHEVEIWETVVQRQRDTVNNLRTRYSAAICQAKEQQDRYVEIQRRIANHVKGLAQANQDEVDFFDEHHAVGAIPYYRPMRVSAVGLASDPNSLATFHHREVKQFCSEELG